MSDASDCFQNAYWPCKMEHFRGHSERIGFKPAFQHLLYQCRLMKLINAGLGQGCAIYAPLFILVAAIVLPNLGSQKMLED